jgi:RimJ/RimL family protein N-acetyltransferase
MTIILLMQRPPNLQTERLVLVPLLPEEIEALIARDCGRFAELSGFRFPPDNPDIGDLAWHLAAIQADDRHLAWRMRAIVQRSSKMVVGSINLKGPPTAAGDVEIGWGLIEDVRGRGYATEAAAAVIKWAQEQSGVRSISATIPDDNYPSQRLAKRLGLSRTSETRRELPLWRLEGHPAMNAAR